MVYVVKSFGRGHLPNMSSTCRWNCSIAIVINFLCHWIPAFYRLPIFQSDKISVSESLFRLLPPSTELCVWLRERQILRWIGKIHRSSITIRFLWKNFVELCQCCQEAHYSLFRITDRPHENSLHVIKKRIKLKFWICAIKTFWMRSNNVTWKWRFLRFAALLRHYNVCGAHPR